MCGGHLELMPMLKQDGTPRATRTPSAFSLFVKRHYARTKCEQPGATHGDVMRALASTYKATKA